jgi:hypothetical protein
MFRTLTFSFIPARDAGDAPKAAPEPRTTSEETVPANDPPPEADAAAELKQTLLKAVEERARRAEGSVLRSMAEQNGVPEAELARMLDEARADRTEAIPPEARRKLDALNESASHRLLMAEVKNVGAELGLLDAEVALSLMNPETLTVAEDCAVTGVREALESLKQRKGYLFAQAGRGAWAQKVSSGGAPPLTGVEEAFYRKNPALRR